MTVGDLARVGPADAEFAELLVEDWGIAHGGGGLHNANLIASPKVCRLYNDPVGPLRHNAGMAKTRDPERPKNFLKAWREFPMPGRGKLTQQQLADKVGTTKSVISLLESGDRRLSHKWAQRIAPHLWIQPGWLLDRDPEEISTDVLERWVLIPEERRPQALAVLDTFVKKPGTTPR